MIPPGLAAKCAGPPLSGTEIREETDVSSETNKTNIETKLDLSSHYRPLGLKAVAAAAMMLKRKPALSPAR